MFPRITTSLTLSTELAHMGTSISMATLSTAPVPFSTTDSSRIFSRIRRIMSSGAVTSAGMVDVSLHLLSSTGIFYQVPVDFYARRCQISHTALLILFISLRLSSSGSPVLLKCELYLRTVLVKLRNSLVTWLHSKPITARFAQQFAFYRFAISQFADYPPPLKHAHKRSPQSPARWKTDACKRDPARKEDTN